MIISELILFVILTCFMIFIALSIIYSSVKVGITPMPSSKKAYLAMMQLVSDTGTGTIVDLGSGWGNFVIRIAKQYPQRKIVGYELSFLPWLTATLLKKLFNLKNLTLYRQNFYLADLSDASVLVCYLFPEAMEKISHKLQTEHANVHFVISNNFALPSYKPSKTVRLNDFYKSPIYLYKISKERAESVIK
ncbi:MAG: class I SAM-dependent methyltransferase [Colwellia sp.]